jgi:hypothetical protein
MGTPEQARPVTPAQLDRALRQAFRFEAADLAANREGRLSPRQTVLLGAGRAGMWLSLGVFTAVMLGSVGLVAFFNWRLDTPGGWERGVGIAGAVAALVVGIGYIVSRRHLSAAGSRHVMVARGPIEILSETDQNCRVRIGGTVLRLPGVDTVEAFQSGAEYRLYYLAGPVAMILSGESLADRGTSAERAADPDADALEHAAAIAQIVVVRRGYLIVVLLGLLTLGIPVAGILAGDLPPRLRPIAWIGLLVAAVGFAWLALSWLTPRTRRGA